MTARRTRTKGSRRLGRLGQSLIEFTFVGIPLMFVLISIFEISRGMWVYHTLAHATKTAARYSIVHGQNCVAPAANTCAVTIGTIAQQFQNAGVGLDLATTSINFIDNGGTVTCTLSACLGNSTTWPTASGNAPSQVITIEATTPFKSAIALFWPGATPVNVAAVVLPARASERVVF